MDTFPFRSVLVTGSAGFIGSHYVIHMSQKHPKTKFVSLDSLSYAGNLDNLQEIMALENHLFVKGDINDESLLSHLFSKHRFDAVIHFAAESHVDNSIHSAKPFVQTNVMGTSNLLDAAKNLWIKAPHETHAEFFHARFHHVSTDEVYGHLGKEGFFEETTPLSPRSPYSASKASSDLMVSAFQSTHGLPSIITRCSNNYGSKQHGEKLIPTIIRNATKKQPIPVYGKGENVRDWLHVSDHVLALEHILCFGEKSEVYNIGGHEEKTTLQVVQKVCESLDSLCQEKVPHIKYQTFVGDRPGHDLRYAINPNKTKALGWEPKRLFDEAIFETVQWYIQNPKWLEV